MQSSAFDCCVRFVIHGFCENFNFGFGGNGGGSLPLQSFCGELSELVDVTTAALLYKLSIELRSHDDEPDDEVDI